MTLHTAAGKALYAQRVGQLARVDGIFKAGNFQSYAASPYQAYTGMWGLNVSQNDTLQADSAVRVDPATFPVGTILAWDITRDPDWSGVEGFLSVSYGNYDDSVGGITPWQVYAITSLAVDIGWTFSGDASTGLLAECWLSTASAPSGSFTKTHEVAFWPKVSATAASYVAGLPTVGAGSFTDSNGVVWNVHVDTTTNPQPYFIAYQPSNADFQGVLPFKDLMAFLIASGKITGNEWFNGLAFGAEPYSGAGALGVDTFTPTYAGAARVPWTISDLSAAVQDATTVNLTWTPAPGATSHQYQVNGGAWTTTSGSSSQTVTGLAASTAYTFAVRGVNATGNGATSNTASATTPSAGPTNLITNGDFSNSDTGWGGFWYSGKAVTNGKAVFTNSPAYDGITQSVTLVAGKYYELTWTLSGYVSGDIYPRFTGGTTVNGAGHGANGTYTQRMLASAGNNVFEILMDVGGTVSVDDVSLIGPYDTATVGGA